ncbi:MAG: cytochrome c3 family protein [Chromatiales bacterium]|nr:cytochrome c3 family protein [Chromatiales bacterium]
MRTKPRAETWSRCARRALLLLVALLALPALAGKNDTCEVCHQDSHLTARNPDIAVSDADIAPTVHAGFACIDCHYTGFDDYPHNTLLHRPDCGECHEEQQAAYHESSHHQARARGNLDAPLCVDCHGNHDIRPPKEQLGGERGIAVCTDCHADARLNSQFKLKADVVAGFRSTYHGQMYRLGFEGDDYATCVSCHDNHAILGADSPDSTVARANLVETCGQCHDDANDNFVGYLTHWQPGDGEYPWLDLAFHAMEALFWGVMIVFGLHTFLWFMRTLVAHGSAGLPKARREDKVIRRFSLWHRSMHIVLVISFLTLALSGLPVKFSDSDSAQWIARHLLGFEAAAMAHRIAGVTLIVLFFVHLGEIAFRALVRREWGILWGWNSLVPNLKDIRDFIEHFAWFLYLRKQPPKFDRWTYWEKFDYLAVFWGMVVIGLSGLMLMLPHATTALLPGWSLNVAHIVHSEEALLATAFIFIVHFFNTHLRPTAFPLDEVIFTGRTSLERLKHERPLEYARLMAAGGIDAIQVEPLPQWKITAVRLMGFGFVLIGLALLWVIVTS